LQTTNSIFLIEPTSFSFNIETANSNDFQNQLENLPDEEIKQSALAEFNVLKIKLIEHGINVYVFKDTEIPIKPDAIFPNNWITIHASGELIIYPMCNTNRRNEKRDDIINWIKENYNITNLTDLSFYERKEIFLEGTGSVVFNHKNKIAYGCLSPRTNKDLFIKVAKELGYEPIYFHAFDEKNKLIYHTNVMMSIGPGFAVICLESITDSEERERVTNSLLDTQHEIIEISFKQVNNFAGNMLSLNTKAGTRLVMSQRAFNSLSERQLQQLNRYCIPLAVDVNTIETIGGGSVRCMMTEIFASKKTSQ
jgi:hypothetical protein